jgi:hypothetical protein
MAPAQKPSRKSSAKSVLKKPTAKKYIYWCHTNLPEYYDFIYGSKALQVKKKYNLSVLPGTGVENIIARRICEIPQAVLKKLKIKESCDLAEDDLLFQSGIYFLQKDGSEFRYKGKLYREEGIMDERYNEDGKPAVYLFQVKERLRFKIGHSQNVGRRLKELSKPDMMVISDVIDTPNAKRLERELIKHFKNFQIYNEYIELDNWGSFLLETTFSVYSLEYHGTAEGHKPSSRFIVFIKLLKPYIENHILNIEPSEDAVAYVSTISKMVKKQSSEEADKIIEDVHRQLFGDKFSSEMEESSRKKKT